MNYLRLTSIAFAIILLSSGQRSEVSAFGNRNLTITAYAGLTLYIDGVECTKLKHSSTPAMPDIVPLPSGVGVIAIKATASPGFRDNPKFMAVDSSGNLRDSSWRCFAGEETLDWMEPGVDSSTWSEAVDLDRNGGAVPTMDEDEFWIGLLGNESDLFTNIFCRIDLLSSVRTFQVEAVSGVTLYNLTKICFQCNRKMICASQCLQLGNGCSGFDFDALGASCCLLEGSFQVDYPESLLEKDVHIFGNKAKKIKY